MKAMQLVSKEPMATTLSNVQASMAYRQHQDAIYQALDTIKQLMNAHEANAKAEGIHWGHVGDLTEVLNFLQRITQPRQGE